MYFKSIRYVDVVELPFLGDMYIRKGYKTTNNANIIKYNISFSKKHAKFFCKNNFRKFLSTYNPGKNFTKKLDVFLYRPDDST